MIAKYTLTKILLDIKMRGTRFTTLHNVTADNLDIEPHADNVTTRNPLNIATINESIKGLPSHSRKESERLEFAGTHEHNSATNAPSLLSFLF